MHPVFLSGNSKHSVINALLKVSVRYDKKIPNRQTSQYMSKKDHKGGEAQAKSFPSNGSQPGEKNPKDQCAQRHWGLRERGIIREAHVVQQG